VAVGFLYRSWLNLLLITRKKEKSAVSILSFALGPIFGSFDIAGSDVRNIQKGEREAKELRLQRKRPLKGERGHEKEIANKIAISEQKQR
jgi:hypothetical protein